METSDFRSASGLQLVRGMKLGAVAILAIFTLVGCGVGADETYDGVTLVTSSGQALEGAGAGEPTVPVIPTLPSIPLPQVPATTTTSPLHDPSTVALPQDPIPVFEGRPATQPSQAVDPLLGTTPAPRPAVF